MLLQNKTALVTGATGGIGQAIALNLVQNGANVILSGTREQVLADVKDRMISCVPSAQIAVLPCNLSDAAAVDALFEQAESFFGSIQILINNAGITRDGLLMRMKDDDWNDVLTVNLSSVFRLSRSAVKRMMREKYGRIINITSVVGITGNPGQTNYCASKAGIIGFSKALAQEVASRNITVNCVAPGFIETDMTASLGDAARQKILTTIPQNKMGTPEDIAHATTFLASDHAAYITGHTLHVNGGMAMV
ncbi:MAG: 3-oxoacyl-ACP reductase FabG [Alphaproteobacteria bacterium]|nr:3-oxoacyl-ACP reductase FabG [Alphaproteobacteria bacterium]